MDIIRKSTLVNVFFQVYVIFFTQETGMTLTAFVLILLSILLHSLWHFLCKSCAKVSMAFFALFSTSLFLSMLPLALCSGLLFDLPGKVMFYAFWGAFSGAMCNVGLMLAYKHSDISLAYPMARALPVFLTMAVTAVLGIGKSRSAAAVSGMLIIFAGWVFMAFSNGDRSSSPLEKLLSVKKGLTGILIAATGTTGYTIIDSVGIKMMTASFPENNRLLVVSCYSCFRELIALTMMWIFVYICYRCGRDRGSVRKLAATWNPYLAGVFAAFAYALVLLAMNHVSNVSFVQAFRQLSLPIGAFLGYLILKEKITRSRWIGLGLIMAGLLLSVL